MPAMPSVSDRHKNLAHAPSAAPPVVLVFLKAPRPGLVKTRLAADIGAAQATHVYRLLAERQLAAIPADWPVEVHFYPVDAHAEMRAWLGPRPALHPQSAGDLGAKLTYAVAEAFERGAPSVLVVGGDCPGLDASLLTLAAAGFDQHDVILGPASDGGYYLIGLRTARPRLFEGIPWSTSEVLRTTLARVAESGVTPLLLPLRDDVDTVDDLRRHAAELLGLNSTISAGISTS